MKLDQEVNTREKVRTRICRREVQHTIRELNPKFGLELSGAKAKKIKK